MAAQEAADQAEAEVRLDEVINELEEEKSIDEHDLSREERTKMKNDPRHRGSCSILLCMSLCILFVNFL